MTHLKSSFDTIALELIHFCFTLVIQPDIPTNTKEKLYNGLVAGSQVTTQVVQSLLKLHVTLLYTLHGWFAYRVLLNQCAHCRFLFLAPFYNSPDGWVGITYQVEELVIPSLADVVCPGATIYDYFVYAPDGWWKHRRSAAHHHTKTLSWYNGTVVVTTNVGGVKVVQ